MPRFRFGISFRAVFDVVGTFSVCHHLHATIVAALDAQVAMPTNSGAREGFVVADVGWVVDAVREEVGHAQDVREVLLLDAGEAVLDGAFVGLGLGLFAQVLDGTDEEATRAARRIEEGLAEAGIDLLDDELGDSARLLAVFSEYVALAHSPSAFTPSERRLIKGHVANKIEGIDLAADLLGKFIEENTVVGKLSNR